MQTLPQYAFALQRLWGFAVMGQPVSFIEIRKESAAMDRLDPHIF